ncbi:hypothetical protein GH714_001807 [Hevea brasiliensis]|uniref:RING-type E3 ubiquitin transferase n=1 Tax=Hevea brasiliensis TaxID=3981 RepID=A0A6A6LAZ8_HEVBR|nr:hypothetical protein GH714_001807 [Hevea brasiliensis]
MGDAMVDRYWCHMCSRMVTPVMEAEIKCPFCDNGFVEEMDSTRELNNDGIDFGSERAFSLWAPILFGLMGGLGPSRARAQEENSRSSSSNAQEENGELERELRSLFRRPRRRSQASILGMLQDLRSGSENSENNGESTTNSSNNNSNSMILVNPFNEEALVLQGSFDVNQSENPIRNMASSLGDYLIGPGLDLLLQHLSENDPNHYGTPLHRRKRFKQCQLLLLSRACSAQQMAREAMMLQQHGDGVEGANSNGEGIGSLSMAFRRLFSFSTSQNGGSSTSPPSTATRPGNPSHTDET